MKKSNNNRNMNSRVCIIRSNPVRPDSRVEKEAWTIQQAGYHVRILSWDRDSDHDEENGVITVAGKEIPITWLGYKAAYNAGMKSIKPYLKFQFHMRRWLEKHKSEIDIIHACDFDTAFFSQSKARNKVFVYDIFDFLYGEPKSLLQRTVRRAQLNIVNRADATIICTEERNEQIAEAKPKRLAVIHNTPFKEQQTQSNLVFQSDSKRVKIAYVGILADERLLTAIGHYISNANDVELHIGGFGPLEEYYKTLADNNDNIFFYGRIPYNQTLELEKQCDIMVAIYNPSDENCRLAAPNKFYESLMLGKPVIMAKGTGMSRVVEQNDIGELIEFSEEGFEEGLRKLLSRRDEWPAMSERMKKLYTEQYSWDEMRRRLIDLYEQLSQCKRKKV